MGACASCSGAEKVHAESTPAKQRNAFEYNPIMTPMPGKVVHISICVVQARNLPSNDLFSKSDPYFAVTCGDMVKKTNVILNCSAPVFNQRLDFISSEQMPDSIAVQLFDYEVTHADVPVAGFVHDITKINFSPYPPFQWCSLGHADSQVQLQVSCVTLEKGKPDTESLTRIVNSTGVYMISIPRLQNLKSQVNGMIYLVVEHGQHGFRSKSVSAHQQNFDSKCYVWVNENEEHYILRVSLFERSGNKSELIGRAYVDTSKMRGGEQTFRVELRKQTGAITDAQLAEYLHYMADSSDENFNETDVHALPTPTTAVSDANLYENAAVTPQSADESTPSATEEAAAIRSAPSLADGPVVGEVVMSVKYERKEIIEKMFYERLLRFDDNNDGKFTKAEWIAVVSCVNPAATNEEINDLFVHLDRDSNDFLERDELIRYLGSAQFQTSQLSYQLLLYLMDGKQSIDEMAMSFYHTTEGTSSASQAASVLHIKDGDTVITDDLGLKVIDRISGLVTDENIPNYIKMAMQMMYRNGFGKTLTQSSAIRSVLHDMSVRQGAHMDTPQSASKIPDFVQQHKINVHEILRPLEEFKTFNEFFYRQLKPGCRPIAEPDDPAVAVSPADCRLVVFENIMDATAIWVKGSKFTVETLLGPDFQDEAPKFIGGSFCIARLAPQDYHRWHLPVACKAGRRSSIAGALYTVNPIAIRQPLNVYTENKREVCELLTEDFGSVMLVAVGATMVGSISILAPHLPASSTEADMATAQSLDKGCEHGYFAFGGSTVLLLFQPGKIEFDHDLVANSKKSLETLVRVGMRIGKAKQTSQKQLPSD